MAYTERTSKFKLNFKLELQGQVSKRAREMDHPFWHLEPQKRLPRVLELADLIVQTTETDRAFRARFEKVETNKQTRVTVVKSFFSDKIRAVLGFSEADEEAKEAVKERVLAPERSVGHTGNQLLPSQNSAYV